MDPYSETLGNGNTTDMYENTTPMPVVEASIEDFESDPKWEMTTLEKASYDIVQLENAYVEESRTNQSSEPTMRDNEPVAEDQLEQQLQPKLPQEEQAQILDDSQGANVEEETAVTDIIDNGKSEKMIEQSAELSEMTIPQNKEYKTEDQLDEKHEPRQSKITVGPQVDLLEKEDLHPDTHGKQTCSSPDKSLKYADYHSIEISSFMESDISAEPDTPVIRNEIDLKGGVGVYDITANEPHVCEQSDPPMNCSIIEIEACPREETVADVNEPESTKADEQNFELPAVCKSGLDDLSELACIKSQESELKKIEGEEEEEKLESPIIKDQPQDSTITEELRVAATEKEPQSVEETNSSLVQPDPTPTPKKRGRKPVVTQSEPRPKRTKSTPKNLQDSIEETPRRGERKSRDEEKFKVEEKPVVEEKSKDEDKNEDAEVLKDEPLSNVKTSVEHHKEKESQDRPVRKGRRRASVVVQVPIKENQEEEEAKDDQVFPVDNPSLHDTIVQDSGRKTPKRSAARQSKKIKLTIIKPTKRVEKTEMVERVEETPKQKKITVIEPATEPLMRKAPTLSRDLRKLDETFSSSTKAYHCTDCDYSTDRMNNIIYHIKAACSATERRFLDHVEELKKQCHKSPKKTGASNRRAM